jgi:hypothetical protein
MPTTEETLCQQQEGTSATEKTKEATAGMPSITETPGAAGTLSAAFHSRIKKTET